MSAVIAITASLAVVGRVADRRPVDDSEVRPISTVPGLQYRLAHRGACSAIASGCHRPMDHLFVGLAERLYELGAHRLINDLFNR